MNTIAWKWLPIKSEDVIQAIDENEFIHLSSSPYNIPVAVRGDEADPSDPDYSLELKYIGEPEKTKSKICDGITYQIGSKSGRVYRIVVNSSKADHRPIYKLLSKHNNNYSTIKNLKEVIAALKSKEKEIDFELINNLK